MNLFSFYLLKKRVYDIAAVTDHSVKKVKLFFNEQEVKVSNFGTADYNRYIHMDGRIIYDLQKEVEKGHNLESYKLDNVAAHFMRGKIKSIESWKRPKFKGKSKLYTTEFGHLKDGDYISLRLHSNMCIIDCIYDYIYNILFILYSS